MTIIKQFQNWHQISTHYSLLKKLKKISTNKYGKEPCKLCNMKFTYLLSVHCSGTSKKFSPRADFMWGYILKMLWLILREKITLATVKSKCVVLYFHEDHSSSEFCGELGTAIKRKVNTNSLLHFMNNFYIDY